MVPTWDVTVIYEALGRTRKDTYVSPHLSYLFSYFDTKNEKSQENME